MSKRILANKKHLFLAIGFAIIMLFSLNAHNNGTEISRLQVCHAINSNLPMNHPSHPCFIAQASSNSWLAWLSGDSQSAYVHFLDIAELIQHSLH